jgi:EmrB/QacA subfamily drug resistance transporter
VSETSHKVHNPWITVTVVCIAQLMVVLDATIVNVALPSIQHSLHISNGNLQWVVNAYTLTFGGFLLLGGRAADIFGRRRLFFAGVGLFSVASLLNALASSSAMLIGSRGLQGLGAALVAPACLAIVNTTFSDPDDQRKALGLWAGIAAGGAAVGLLLGGILTQSLSWPWIFYVNVPIGFIAILLAIRYVPDSPGEGAGSGTDFSGALSVTAGLALLIYAIVNTQTSGWGSATTIGLGAAAVALLVSFVVIESRTRAPLVRLSIFRVRALAVGDAAMLFLAAGMFANFFFGTLYIQEILHFTPIGAGFAFLPVALLIGAGAGAAQKLIPKFGIRSVAIAGMVIAAAGLLLMMRVSIHGTYVGTLLPSFILLAIGLGLAFVPATLIGVSSVVDDDSGLASGLFNTAQQVGGALGLAVLSTLAVTHTSGVLRGIAHPSAHAVAVATVSGYRIAFAVAAGFMVLAIIVLATFLRSGHLEGVDDGVVAVSGAAAPPVPEPAPA